MESTKKSEEITGVSGSQPVEKSSSAARKSEHEEILKYFLKGNHVIGALIQEIKARPFMWDSNIYISTKNRFAEWERVAQTLTYRFGFDGVKPETITELAYALRDKWNNIKNSYFNARLSNRRYIHDYMLEFLKPVLEGRNAKMKQQSRLSAGASTSRKQSTLHYNSLEGFTIASGKQRSISSARPSCSKLNFGSEIQIKQEPDFQERDLSAENSSILRKSSATKNLVAVSKEDTSVHSDDSLLSRQVLIFPSLSTCNPVSITYNAQACSTNSPSKYISSSERNLSEDFLIREDIEIEPEDIEMDMKQNQILIPQLPIELPEQKLSSCDNTIYSQEAPPSKTFITPDPIDFVTVTTQIKMKPNEKTPPSNDISSCKQINPENIRVKEEYDVHSETDIIAEKNTVHNKSETVLTQKFSSFKDNCPSQSSMLFEHVSSSPSILDQILTIAPKEHLKEQKSSQSKYPSSIPVHEEQIAREVDVEIQERLSVINNETTENGAVGGPQQSLFFQNEFPSEQEKIKNIAKRKRQKMQATISQLPKTTSDNTPAIIDDQHVLNTYGEQMSSSRSKSSGMAQYMSPYQAYPQHMHPFSAHLHHIPQYMPLQNIWTYPHPQGLLMQEQLFYHPNFPLRGQAPYLYDASHGTRMPFPYGMPIPGQVPHVGNIPQPGRFPITMGTPSYRQGHPSQNVQVDHHPARSSTPERERISSEVHQTSEEFLERSTTIESPKEIERPEEALVEDEEELNNENNKVDRNVSPIPEPHNDSQDFDNLIFELFSLAERVMD